MGRILVIEDEESLSTLIRNILESRGHVVATAANGHEGIALMQRQVFDALITDLVLPEQDGLEVIMAVRRTMVRLPILAISGATGNGELYLNIATKLGADAALAKPFTPEQLAAQVDALLARS